MDLRLPSQSKPLEWANKGRNRTVTLIRVFSRLDVLEIFTSTFVPTMTGRLIFNPKQAFRVRIALPENH